MACCGRKSPADVKKSLASGPLVYATDEKPRQGRCPLCKQKGKSETTRADGMNVRFWLCRRGHACPV